MPEVIGNPRRRVLVQLDDGRARGVDEETRVRRPLDLADDAHAEVRDVPVGDGAGIGDVERDVFETKNGQGTSRRVAILLWRRSPQDRPRAVLGACGCYSRRWARRGAARGRGPSMY